MRPAIEADRVLLRLWVRAFAAEALPGDPVPDPDPFIDRWLTGGRRGVRLWDVGALVAAVSAERLVAGERFCVLVTDLANPDLFDAGLLRFLRTRAAWTRTTG
jgi:hypothetical protein